MWTYGFAFRADLAETRIATEELLQQLTQQIAICSAGPRFIAGDWNQELNKLQETKVWESQFKFALACFLTMLCHMECYSCQSGLKPDTFGECRLEIQTSVPRSSMQSLILPHYTLPTKRYQQLCKSFEKVFECSRNHPQCQVTSKHLGRAATHTLTKHHKFATPLKPSRAGEEKPLFEH